MSTPTPIALPHIKIWSVLVDVSAKRKKAKSEEQEFIKHRQYLEKEIAKHKKGTAERKRLCVEYYDTIEAIKGARTAAKWLADKSDKIIDKGIEGKLWEEDDDDGEPTIPEHTDLFDRDDDDDDTDAPAAAAKMVGEPAADAAARSKPTDMVVDLGQQKPAEPAAEPAATPTRGANSKLLVGTRTIGIEGKSGDALYKSGFGVLATVADFFEKHPGRHRQAFVDEVMSKTGVTLGKGVLDKLERAIADAKAADAAATPAPGPVAPADQTDPLDVSLKSFLSEKDEAACRDVGLLTLRDFATALHSGERLPVNETTWKRVAAEIAKRMSTEVAERTPPTKGRKSRAAAG